MKLKVLLLSALFTILAILTSSCKDEASDLSQTSVFTESEYVRYQIDSLNISLFPDQFDPTRGWKQWFKKIAAIAVIDAVGAIMGTYYSSSPAIGAGVAIVASAVATFFQPTISDFWLQPELVVKTR